MTNLLDSRPAGPAAPLPPPPPGAGPHRQPPRPKRTPRGVRFLWKLFAAVLVIGALVWGPYQIVVLLSHEDRVEDESFAAAALTTLEIDGSAGSVQITAADTDTVHVRAEISEGLRRTGESRQIVGDTLRLHSTCPNIGSDWCRVDYDITMPAALAVVVRHGDGRTAISGATGRVDVSNDNGSVELTEVSGPIDASSSNGSVEGVRLTSPTVTASTDNGRISLAFATAPRTVSARSDNGRVDVVVPADGTTYRVDTGTDNGSHTVSVPNTPQSRRSITAHTDNGSITIRTATD